MWAKTKPLISLWQYSQIMGINPFIMAQIGTPSDQLSTARGQCETVFFQTASQYAEHLSREDIAQALVDAQTRIANWTLTYPAPKQTEEEVPYPRPANFGYEQLWHGASRRLKSIQTQWGNVRSVGVQTLTLLDDNLAVVTSDPNSDGFNTYFTTTVAVTAGTTVDQIKCYFSAADRTGLTLAEAEIQGFTVTISGLVATISGSITLLVKPALYLKLVPQDLNVTTAANYVTTIDVYLQTIDLSQSGTLYWDNDDCGDGNPCTASTSSACFKETDKRSGYLQVVPATFDEDTQAFTSIYPYLNRAPDRVVVNYVSGVSLDETGLPRLEWARAVAMLATALLPQSKICGCNQADVILFYYRSMPTTEEGNLQVSQEVLNATSQAFGINNRGAVHAFLQLRQNAYRVYRSVTWNG